MPHFHHFCTSIPVNLDSSGGASKQAIKEYTELCDVAYDLTLKDEVIKDVFQKMWERVEVARQENLVKIGQVKFKEQYEDYSRREEAEPVLKSIFGANCANDKFLFLDAEIANPLLFIESNCFKVPQQGKKGAVHGDLHANNVVIDNLGKVHLIDFAWAGLSEHILVDYVLMECSLRFLLFPHHVDPQEQLKADKWLLDADGARELEGWNTGSTLEGHYRRLGVMLNEVRSEARKFLLADDASVVRHAD